VVGVDSGNNIHDRTIIKIYSLGMTYLYEPYIRYRYPLWGYEPPISNYRLVLELEQ